MDINNRIVNLIANWTYVVGLLFVAIGETKGLSARKGNESNNINNDVYSFLFIKSEIDYYGLSDEDDFPKEIKDHYEDHHRLVVLGEYIETISTALQGFTSIEPLIRLGNFISAVGSGFSTIGSSLQIIAEIPEYLSIEGVGDLLQAIGPLVAEQGEPSEAISIGYKTEALGAVLETIGILIMIKGQMEKGQFILTIGSWVQALGGSIITVFETKRFINDSTIM